MLIWTDYPMHGYQVAKMKVGLGTWIFRIYEKYDCNELHIIAPTGFRRRMGKETFETMSQAKQAAAAFFHEFLSDAR